MLTRHLPQLGRDENRAVIESLEAMISEHRLPHAMIIEGGDGELSGRLARLIARAYLCSCDTPLAGQCRVCRTCEAGGNADILEVSGSGKTGAISVDAVRELKLKGMLRPTEADGMVWLMEDCDIMLAPAQNAFLKLFEEPPDGVMFIMTCASRMKLLETIRSRAFIIHIEWHDADLCQSGEISDLAERFASSIASGSEYDSIMLTARFSRAWKDTPQVRREMLIFTDRLQAILRQAMIIGSGAGQIINNRSDAADELARSISPGRIEAMFLRLDDIRQSIKTNASIPLVTSALCVRLRQAAGR